MINAILSKLLVANIKTGQPSYILTAFIFGTVIVNLKLIFSGVEFHSFKMSEFSGTDYAASMAALGGIYTLNKQIVMSNSKESKE